MLHSDLSNTYLLYPMCTGQESRYRLAGPSTLKLRSWQKLQSHVRLGALFQTHIVAKFSFLQLFFRA